MSLMKFDFGQLKLWLASYHAPLPPMFWGITHAWAVRSWRHSGWCFAPCAKILFATYLWYTFMWSPLTSRCSICIVIYFSNLIYYFLAYCVVLKDSVAKCGILSSDPNCFFIKDFRNTHSARCRYISIVFVMALMHVPISN